MDRLKRLTKPLMALFVVIVFAWLVVVTRYQYKPEPERINKRLTSYQRIDRLTGEIEYKFHKIDTDKQKFESGWKSFGELGEL
jgi:GTPase